MWHGLQMSECVLFGIRIMFPGWNVLNVKLQGIQILGYNSITAQTKLNNSLFGIQLHYNCRC